jgi:hypothetical protein
MLVAGTVGFGLWDEVSRGDPKSVQAWHNGQRPGLRPRCSLCPGSGTDDERNTAGMPERILHHLKGNLVAYLALFVALGGSSYAAVQLAPGSVRTRALAKGAVTHKKLAANSVRSANVLDGSLGRADFKAGVLGAASPGKGDKGDTGTNGAAGRAGGAYIGARARSTGPVQAPHGGSTNVPLSANGWTQAAGELDLIAGSVTVTTPPACTGSFGNTLLVSVDGKTTTFGVPPQVPPSSSVTVPIVVGTLTEPAAGAQHQMTASLANSCTKDGEDFTVSDVSLDILKFN